MGDVSRNLYSDNHRSTDHLHLRIVSNTDHYNLYFYMTLCNTKCRVLAKPRILLYYDSTGDSVHLNF